MSDGPYKSLQMRKGWKEVAMRAYKSVYTPDEIADAMCSALHADIRRDAGPEFINALGHVLVDAEQRNLFADQAAAELAALRDRYPPGSFAEYILEHTESSLHDGFSGANALADGVRRAAIEYGEGCNRQVEEHCHREALNAQDRVKAVEVRAKLDLSLRSDQVARIGQDIVDMARGKKVVTKLEKMMDVDVGPVVP